VDPELGANGFKPAPLLPQNRCGSLTHDSKRLSPHNLRNLHVILTSYSHSLPIISSASKMLLPPSSLGSRLSCSTFASSVHKEDYFFCMHDAVEMNSPVCPLYQNHPSPRNHPLLHLRVHRLPSVSRSAIRCSVFSPIVLWIHCGNCQDLSLTLSLLWRDQLFDVPVDEELLEFQASIANPGITPLTT
jgi:hypothetical protein